MNLITKNIGVWVALIFIAIAVMFYNAFFKSDTASMPTDLPSANIGSEALATLNGLQSVTLNRSIFSTPGYLLLTDFSTTIPVQPTGRNNPFDVIGK